MRRFMIGALLSSLVLSCGAPKNDDFDGPARTIVVRVDDPDPWDLWTSWCENKVNIACQPAANVPRTSGQTS